MTSEKATRIYEFASKWLKLYQSDETTTRELEVTDFARGCEALGFVMDGGKVFERAYSGATVSNLVMESTCRLITDVDLLGAGIYSQWRYWTHWGQRDLTDPEIREWFCFGLSRMLALSTFPTFEGEVAKIVITFEDSGYCPPAPGQEVRQRLTINKNGSVTLTRWFAGDFTVVPPVTRETKKMRRFREKPTEKVMENIADYFREYHELHYVCDGGMWVIRLTNADGENWDYTGSLGDDLEVHFERLSDFTRKALEIKELWMFDGGEVPDEE